MLRKQTRAYFNKVTAYIKSYSFKVYDVHKETVQLWLPTNDRVYKHVNI